MHRSRGCSHDKASKQPAQDVSKTQSNHRHVPCQRQVKWPPHHTLAHKLISNRTCCGDEEVGESPNSARQSMVALALVKFKVRCRSFIFGHRITPGLFYRHQWMRHGTSACPPLRDGPTRTSSCCDASCRHWALWHRRAWWDGGLAQSSTSYPL